MLPVIFSIGQFSLTSAGLALFIAISGALFVIWRLSLVYELDKERVIDLFILTTLVAFLGSRLSFVLLNQAPFRQHPVDIFLIVSHPGFSFWGGFLAALIFLLIICFRHKQQFWLIADLAIVGAAFALSITNLGCLFAGCGFGYPSHLPIAVYQAGVPENRFPIQIFESFIYFLIFLKLYSMSKQFHYNGAIISRGLVLIGLTQFIFSFFRADVAKNSIGIANNQLVSILLVLFGLYGIYRQGKRSLTRDLQALLLTLTSFRRQKELLSKLAKGWYTLRINFWFRLSQTSKKVLRKHNVRTNQREPI